MTVDQGRRRNFQKGGYELGNCDHIAVVDPAYLKGGVHKIMDACCLLLKQFFFGGGGLVILRIKSAEFS